MADNVTLNSGSGGDTMAADDISGVKYPRVKLCVGVDGVANDVADANPVPVSDAGGSLTVDGSVSAAQSGNWTVFSIPNDQEDCYTLHADSVLTASRHHLSILNGHATKIIKVWKVWVALGTEAAVTGLVARFKLLRITGITGGSAANTTKHRTAAAGLTTATVVTQPSSVSGASTGSFGSGSVSSEETALQVDTKVLFQADAFVQPITLLQNEGITIQQGALTGSAGTIAVYAIVTEE